jgi:hypothetical protein
VGEDRGWQAEGTVSAKEARSEEVHPSPALCCD